MPAPSNKKKSAKKATTTALKPPATTVFLPPALQSPPAPLPSTGQPPISQPSSLQPPVSLPQAVQTLEFNTATPNLNVFQQTFNFAFFLTNATFRDINRFVDTVSVTDEGRNLQLLWRRAVSEGRAIGKEEGIELGYDSGYLDGQQAEVDSRKRTVDDFGEEIRREISIQTESLAPTVNCSTQTERFEFEDLLHPRKLTLHDSSSQTASQLVTALKSISPVITATSLDPANAEIAHSCDATSPSAFPIAFESPGGSNTLQMSYFIEKQPETAKLTTSTPRMPRLSDDTSISHIPDLPMASSTARSPQNASKTVNHLEKLPENAKIAIAMPENGSSKTPMANETLSSSQGTTYMSPMPSFAVCDPSIIPESSKTSKFVENGPESPKLNLLSPSMPVDDLPSMATTRCESLSPSFAVFELLLPSSSSNFVKNHLKSPKIELFSPPMPEINLPSPLATVRELPALSVAIFEPPSSENSSKISKFIEKSPKNPKIIAAVPENESLRPANASTTITESPAASDTFLFVENPLKNANFVEIPPKTSKLVCSKSVSVTSATTLDCAIQTTPTIDYEAQADPQVLENSCALASTALSNTPLGAIWDRATKSGYDEGSRMVDGLSVTDLLQTGFEKGTVHGITAEREYHSQFCVAVTKPPTCDMGTQVHDVDPLNNPEAIDILCAFSSTAPSTTPFGLIWQRAFKAGTQANQPQTPPHVDISIQTTNEPIPPPENMTTLDWADEPVVIEPMFPPPPPKYEPRDLSVLRSSSPTPFSSLERRSKRPYTHSRQSRYRRTRFNVDFSQPSIQSPNPKKIFPHKIPPSFPVTSSSLDWNEDPHLSDLSSALRALGWVRNS